MELINFSNSLQFVLHLSLPIFVGILIASVVSGIFQAVTQINDVSISYLARFTGLVVVLYFFGGYYSGEIQNFAMGLWGNVQIYK